jgi:hypothetical protein
MTTSYGRLRFETTGVETGEPRCISHKFCGVQRRHQIELEEIYGIQGGIREMGNDPAYSIYASSIGKCFHALPTHIRRLVGNIPEYDLPDDFDFTEPTDLLVTTDG